MNFNVTRGAAIAVTICVILGMAGILRTELAEKQHHPLERAVTVFIGSLLSLQLEIAGMYEPLGDSLLTSGKPAYAAITSEPTQQEHRMQDQQQEKKKESESNASSDASEEETAEEEVKTPPKEESKPAEPETADSLKDRKLVFIYHSHSRESWLPELKGKEKPNEAFDAEVNITLLGKRLKEQLEKHKIGAVHSDTDYHAAIPSFNYNYSYKYSNKSVKEALAVHRDLVYLFDLHRDSQRKEETTVTIDGKTYSKLYFIIGQANPNWEQNAAFAEKIHQAIEVKLPGISKGILTKGERHGHGEYNQSLSPYSVLIELGGVDNTLEENYRTIDVLASVIAELVMEAEKANAPAAE